MKGFFIQNLGLAVFFVLSANLSGQEYTPMDFSEGATWSHTECNYKPDYGAVYKFKIFGDTLLNENIYKKVYYQYKRGEGVCVNCDFTFNRDSAILFALVRESTPKRKVYFVYPGHSDKEWLGYDFDITAVGQSVTGFSLIFTTEPESSTAAIYVYQMVVDAIDSLCVNGTWRRRYYYGPGNGGNIYHRAEHWVEGIGSTHGLLVQGFGGPDWEHGLYCFLNKEGPVYYDTAAILNCVEESSVTCHEGMDCSPITAIPAFGEGKEINIFPNPVTDWLYVECKKSPATLEVKVWSMMGTEAFSTMLTAPAEVTSVSLGDLPPGFYYVTVRTPEDFKGMKLLKH